MNEIITKEEQQFLLEWIFKNEDKFTPNYNGPHRKFLILNKTENVPELFYEIKKRIIEKENIKEWEHDALVGDAVLFHTEGGFIHKHIDPTLPNKESIRFNLFLSKPKKGGDPILMGQKLRFEERQYLRYHGNKQVHKSLPVEGDKPRIVITYGIFIPSDPGSIA